MNRHLCSLVCALVFSLLLAATASAAPQFTVTPPPGWKAVQPPADKELVRIFTAPDGAAFIEVYAHKMADPGLRSFAREWTKSGVHGGLLFTKMLTTDQGFHNGVDRLARTYTGMYSGRKVNSALHVYYHEGYAFLLQAVYPSSQAAGLGQAITDSLDSFRLTGAEYYEHDTTGCNRVLGHWKWFTGKLVTLLPDGKIEGSHISTWECLDENAGKYQFNWSNGQYVDTLYLDYGGNRLSGTNNRKQPVHADRVRQDGVPYAQPPAPGYATEPLLGTWTWFTGTTVKFLADGKIENAPGSFWQLIDAQNRTYKISWNNGAYVDTLSLNASGNHLEGSNLQNERVYADRLSPQTAPEYPPAQPAPLPDSQTNRAWKISGNTMAQWGVARGSVNSAATPSIWEIKTDHAIGLHFRNQSSRAYSVEIREKQSGILSTAIGVSSFGKVRIGPGHFVITVRAQNGSSSWTCDWE